MTKDATPIELGLVFVNLQYSKMASLATTTTQTIQKFFREIVKLFNAVASAGKGDNSITSVVNSLTKLAGEGAPVGAALTKVQDALNNTVKSLDALAKDTATDAGKVVTAINNMVTSVNTALANMVKGASGIGKNLDAGLASGIAAGQSSVINAATAAANSATKAANTAVGNASPSKVFHLIGTNMMAGMANGITEGFRNHVTPALNAAAQGITNGFKPSLHTPTVALGGTSLALGANVRTGVNVTPTLPGGAAGLGSTTIHANPQYSVVVQGTADVQTVDKMKKMLDQHDRDLLQKIKAR